MASSTTLPPHPAPTSSLLHRGVSAAPGAQVVGLYEAADDGANQAAWGGDEDGDVFRIAVVVTGSLFAEETGFDSSVRCGAAMCQYRAPEHKDICRLDQIRCRVVYYLIASNFPLSLPISFTSPLSPRLPSLPPRFSRTTTRTRPTYASGPHSQDESTWVIPHGVTVAQLQERLSSAGVHPVFLLTDASLEDEYRALIGEIGFGAVVAVDQAAAAATNYNDDYLPKAMMDGLEVDATMMLHLNVKSLPA